MTSKESNVALIERFYLWNQFDKSLIPVLLAEDLEFRGSLGQKRGHREFGGYVDFVRAAFPDFSNTVEEVVSDGDRSFARLTYGGELFGGRRRPRRNVIGSSDGMGAYPRERPVPISDLAATIYHALGVDPRGQLQDIEGQARYICDGNPVLEMF